MITNVVGEVVCESAGKQPSDASSQQPSKSRVRVQRFSRQRNMNQN